MTTTDINLYINWVLLAVYGRLAEADIVMRMHGDSVRRVAAALRKQFPVPARQLYRGVLLDPAEMLRADPNYMFVSWSEDLDVARWFASPDAYISAPISERYPEARGFVLVTSDAHDRVLFHHAWRFVLAAGLGGRSLEELALMHPHMGTEGHRQIGWSLDTQHEVITEPLATMPPPVPVDMMPGAPVAELDARLCPPWISDELGFEIAVFNIEQVRA